ncbi:hypothetical protein Pse7429DRAFT_4105 [Pseudanabaena biceps PCC 7429]|uniref:Uncharacterized protein n=1 Tax=Pseudanabaena biceps PCC 7429 TaxID=927668 RepID=L8MTH1_9CYAN|nr:hypothetical protein Pse7429DRAFT_4105 [Pseudanabaena biceps PCC 7429]
MQAIALSELKIIFGWLIRSSYPLYSYIHLSQDIKPHRELRRKAPQLSMGFDFCSNITDYSYTNSLK